MVATQPKQFETFVRLSEALTAEKALPVDLAGAYFKRAQDSFGDGFGTLLDRFATATTGGGDPVAAIRTQILPDANLGPAARGVLRLWYIGRIQKREGWG